MTAVVVPLPNIWGASAEDWTHFDLMLGLTDDLLPVVSNPHVEIAEGSTLKSLGKVPSVYTRDRKVVGLKNWTVRCTTGAEIEGWMQERDYGICVQTRRCRAIDIDVDDPAKAGRIAAWWQKSLGGEVNKRVRDGSGKCLIPVMAEGELAKIVIRVDGGAVEILGNGQQFIAAGTHPKGARYRWEGSGLAAVADAEALRTLAAEFAAAFAVDPVIEGKLPGEREADVDADDPVADWLRERGLVLREEPRGLIVACPWAHEHSDERAEAMWLPAGGRGKAEGHFRCLHAHCEHRTRADYLAAVGYQEDVASQFEDLGAEETDVPLAEMVAQEAERKRPKLVPADEFAARPRPTWLIKGVLPKAELGVIYGPSGAGKTFAVLDLCLAVAMGREWRGRRVKQGPVVYLCQEGQGGFQMRLEALQTHHGVKLGDVPLRIVGDSVNVFKFEQVKPLAEAIRATFTDTALIVVDTLAASTPGANENAGEDMGLVLEHCKWLHRNTGALVLLVHHTGKDEERGARGWSGVRGALDCEFMVNRSADDGSVRWLKNTKMKDGKEGDTFGFRLVDVWLGDDEDGDPIESCVLAEETAPKVVVNKGRKGREPGPVEAAVMGALAELSVGGDGKVLKPDLVLKATQIVAEADGSKDFQARFKVNRAITSLITRKRLGREGEIFFDVEG